MVFLTDKAAYRIRKRLEAESRPNGVLRLRVEAGGCAGMSYAFLFEDAAAPGDVVCEKGGARLVVDRASHFFVRGATVEWFTSLMRSEFRVINPNATESCQCGLSFEAPGAMPVSEDARNCDTRRPLSTLTGT